MRYVAIILALLLISAATIKGDRVVVKSGAVATPSITFEDDPDTGIYSPGTNSLNFVTAAANRMKLGASGWMQFGDQAVPADIWTNVGTMRTQYGLLYHGGSFGTSWNWNWYRNGTAPASYQTLGIDGSDDAASISMDATGIHFDYELNWVPGATAPTRVFNLTDTIMSFRPLGVDRWTFSNTTVTLDSSSSATLNLLSSVSPSTDSVIRMGDITNTNDGEIRYDDGDRDLIFRAQDINIGRIGSTGLTVEGINPAKVDIKTSVNSGQSILEFSSFSGPNAANISYDHAGSTMSVDIEGTNRMEINSNIRVSMASGGTEGSNDLCENGISGGLYTILRCSSSRRFKDTIEDLDSTKYKVEDFRPVQYRWKQSHKYDIGFIAEEVQEVHPNLITLEEDGVTPRGVQYRHMVAIAFAEIKKLKEENKNILARLEALENN